MNETDKKLYMEMWHKNHPGYWKIWTKKNKEYANKWRSNYNKRPDRKKKLNEYKRKYYKTPKGRSICLSKSHKYNRTPKGRFSSYKRHARRRKLYFLLSFEDFNAFLNKPCFYCGDISLGLDRIDSSVGYIKENCVPCCFRCNSMKSNLTQSEFFSHIGKIAANHKLSK